VWSFSIRWPRRRRPDSRVGLGDEAQSAASDATSPRKGILASTYYSSVTSTLALIVSAVSAYYTLFYVNRSIKLVLNPFFNETFVEDGFIAGSPVLYNDGNHTEVLVKAELTTRKDSCGTFGRSAVGPFIIKPGEAIALTLKLPLPEIKTYTKIDVYLALQVIRPDGSSVPLNILLERAYAFFDDGTFIGEGWDRRDVPVAVDILSKSYLTGCRYG
jgi:hypothetical protein